MLPGVRSLEGTKFGYPSRLLASGVFTRGGLATPITLIPYSLPADAAKRLEELARGGQFVEPLAGDRNVMFGSVARRVDRKGPVPQPVDEKTDFSRRESEIAVLLNWFPKEKTKSQTSLRVYDLDNRLLVEGKPAKIELTPNHAMATAWQLPIANMPPGIYRVDVLLGQSPVWRTFFRITE